MVFKKTTKKTQQTPPPCLFLCLNPVRLDFKKEESIISTSELSKPARHLWLRDVEKLMTNISSLCRDRRLLSWGINKLALSLHKPVYNFRGDTALSEHVRVCILLGSEEALSGSL